MRHILLLVGTLLISSTVFGQGSEEKTELTDHPMVKNVTNTKQHFVVELVNGKQVKFSNLYPVEFYATDNENRIAFLIRQGRNKVKEGYIRLRSDETAVLVDQGKSAKNAPKVYRGQRLTNDNDVAKTNNE